MLVLVDLSAQPHFSFALILVAGVYHDDIARARPGRTDRSGVERLRPRVEKDSDSIADGYEIGPPVRIEIANGEVRAGAEQALGWILTEGARYVQALERLVVARICVREIHTRTHGLISRRRLRALNPHYCGGTGCQCRDPALEPNARSASWLVRS